MNVETIVRQCGLQSAHVAALGQAIPLGYRALQTLVRTTPMLGQFVPGLKTVGYLRNLAVQHALATQAATTELFFTDTGFNKPGNHAFLKLHAQGVVITAHYAGAQGSRALRKAIARAELSARNGDLFAAESQAVDADVATGHAYVQLRHGGLSTPVYAALYIPNRDQQSTQLEPMLLSMAPPSDAQVEEVTDRLNDAIKRKTREAEEQRHAS
jgi:hypothetical protein